MHFPRHSFVMHVLETRSEGNIDPPGYTRAGTLRTEKSKLS